MFLKSQTTDFAPIGAEWYYNDEAMTTEPAHGYVKYIVEKDTTIENQAIKIVSVTSVSYNGKENKLDNIFLYEENSSIYKIVNDQPVLVFNFLLVKGDTLDISIDKDELCDSITPIIVDSTGIVSIDGNDLKIIYLSYFERFFDSSNNFDKRHYSIIEKIGSTSEFLYVPDCSYESSWTNKILRCYNDNEINYKPDWWSNVACDTLIDETVNIENKSVGHINIYPNPTEGILHIEFANKFTLVLLPFLWVMLFAELFTKSW